MLRYVYGADLPNFPKLQRTMFQDRARQFGDRLNWQVSVDDKGFERDEYDALGPLYVICEDDSGAHAGSMRLLPTTGTTMLNDHFAHLAGAEIRHPLIWECTRFCLSETAGLGASAALALGLLEVGERLHLSDIVGVFDARMIRIYRRLKWEPTVLGTQGDGRDAISVGLWEVAQADRETLLRNAGATDEESSQWFNRCFGHPRQKAMAETA